MAKQAKDKWLGARVDNNTVDKVKQYTQAAEMDMGELVREAVAEFMLNHPIKDPTTKTDVSKPIKPGE